VKVAFYAPMKSPNHPTPSGDRRMARLFLQALEMSGATTQVISQFRSFDKAGDEVLQRRLRDEAEAEANALIRGFEENPETKPDLFFTYHVYHKAPDWIGPKIAAALNIPYYIAEASHAPKQKNGPWKMGYDAAEKAIRAATRILHMTQLDGACLQPLMTSSDQLVHFPPFIEPVPDHPSADMVADWVQQAGGRADRKNLLAVGMMRDGDKFHSYQELVKTVPHLAGDDWQLLIVGDGPRCPDVQALFAPFKEQVIFLGEQSEQELAAIYEYADIYIWPACGEAFGMAFLEAGRAGLPSVSCHIRGVPDVVEDGVSGRLVAEGDCLALATVARNLLDNQDTLATLSVGARQFVAKKRSLKAAALRLSDMIKEDIK